MSGRRKAEDVLGRVDDALDALQSLLKELRVALVDDEEGEPDGHAG